MSRVRLYVDEDAAETAIVNAIAKAGFDVVTAHSASMRGEDDVAQLIYAVTQGRAIYTLNVADYADLHAEFLVTHREHAGIITIPEQRYSVGGKLRRLLALLNAVTAEDMRNQIRYL